MEVNFCDNCDNLMYLYEEEETNKLYLGCKCCGEKKEYENSTCIFSNKYQMDSSETINQNENLEYDVTLPMIKNNSNIECPNAECSSQGKPPNIKYIKYDQPSMKYLYVCINCSQKWTN
tara:strand:+ start:1770 stop:2126 length:357 start_codon:yes stop_codon:yes gene_type:complete